MHPTNTERAPTTFAWAESLPVGNGSPIRTGGVRLAEQMVQVVYNAQHRIPWHWQVPAYLVTKAISAGIFLILAVGIGLGFFGLHSPTLLTGSGISLAFLGLTTVLLVFDLERPERFLRILTRPQWKSWLARGAFVLIAFSIVCTLWFVNEFISMNAAGDSGLDTLRMVLFWVGIPLAGATAVYTAFLFGQAEGRDLWQSTLLPLHLIIQAILAGGAALLVVGQFVTAPNGISESVTRIFGWAILLDLGVLLLGEFGMRHASETAALAARQIRSGRYRQHFWIGSVLVGHLLPLACLALGGILVGLGGIATIAGLYYYEYAFIMAPQEIPNS